MWWLYGGAKSVLMHADGSGQLDAGEFRDALKRLGLDLRRATREGSRCVWTYRDRSLENDWRFPVKLSKSGTE